jgi:ubiquinone/menaquinone biosynthesis C-methylase UbiE
MSDLSLGLTVLLTIFNQRKDLQDAFPEVSSGNLSNILKWAIEYGTSIDNAKDDLLPFLEEYKREYENQSGNEHFWDDSSVNYIKDGFKIYWETLNEIAFYQFECVSGDKNVDILKHTLNILQDRFQTKKMRAAFIGCDELNRTEIKFYKSGLFSEIVVMDIAKGLLDKQRKLAGSENIHSIEYRPTDFNEFTLNENEFDLVFAWGTVHHVKNLEHFFSEIRKGLTKDGIIIMREYVGPTYLQYTDTQLEIVNSLLTMIPEEYRYLQNRKDLKNAEGRIDLEQILKTDPSESVRSSDIIRVMNDHFEIINYQKTGGTLLMPLLSGIAGNFEKDDRGHKVLLALINIEKALIKNGILPSDFVYIVANPKGLRKGSQRS